MKKKLKKKRLIDNKINVLVWLSQSPELRFRDNLFVRGSDFYDINK